MIENVFFVVVVVFPEISKCKSSPCVNNGTCVDIHSGAEHLVDLGEKPYICLCKPGFTGKNCETGTRKFSVYNESIGFENRKPYSSKIK